MSQRAELACYSAWLLIMGVWLIWSNTRAKREEKRRKAMLKSVLEEARRRAQ